MSAEIITTPKRGELYAFSGYMGKLYAGVYRGEGSGTFQFIRIEEVNVERMKEGKKPYVDYIGGSVMAKRIVRVDERVLSLEDQKITREIKQLMI